MAVFLVIDLDETPVIKWLTQKFSSGCSFVCLIDASMYKEVIRFDYHGSHIK